MDLVANVSAAVNICTPFGVDELNGLIFAAAAGE